MPAKAKLTTRERTTSNVSTDNLNKGSELSFAEADSNFINLRDQSIAISDGSTTTDIEAGETITFSGASVSGNTVTVPTGAGITVVGDDSTGTLINGGETLKIAGGSNVTTAMSGDTLTITSSGGGASLGDLTAVGSTLLAPSNANLRLQASNGSVEVQDTFIVSQTQAADETQGEMMRVQSTGSFGVDVDFNHNGNMSGDFSIYGNDGQSAGGNVPFQVQFGQQADVKINGYKMPTTDGTANQVIKTDGSDTLAFTDITNLIPASYVQDTDTFLTVVGDDSSGTGFNVGETLKVAGGNGCSATVSGDTVTIDFDQSSIPTQPANTGDFEFAGSTMSGQVTNGDITFQPNGTGDIILDTDTVKVGSGSEHVVIQPNGTNNLQLLGGSGQSIQIVNTDVDSGAKSITLGTQFSIFGTGTANPRITSRGAYDITLQTDSGNGTKTLQIRHSGLTAVDINGGALSLNDNNITEVATINAVQLETQGVAINDNNITSRGSNADLVLDASGTGAIQMLTQKVIMANLPTSDPTNAGQLWNDSGTLKVSAG